MNVKRIAIIVAILLLVTIPETTPFTIYKTNYKLNNGKTLYVGGKGPNNYTCIQDAINDSKDGDTIIVFYNIYHENITIDKSICLIGVEIDGKKPVINGGNSKFAVKIVANNCTLKNLEVKLNASITMEIYSSGNIIENCHIINLPKEITCGYECGYALSIDRSNYNRLINNTIETKQEACGIAIKMFRCSENEFIDNKILTGGSDYDSIWIEEGGNNFFYNNTIEGLECFSSNKNQFYENEFISRVFIYGCNDNIFENNSFRSVKLFFSINLTLKNNVFRGALSIYGNKLVYYNTHTIRNNTKYSSDGFKKILYYKNSPNIIISGNFGEVILVNCNNSIIKNVIITESSIAIFVVYSTNVSIYNCSISHGKGGCGIMLTNSNKCVIEKNNISKIAEGILIYSSRNTMILKNHIEKTERGIVISQSIHTILKGNRICNNSCGIYVYHSFYTVIKRNELRRNFDGIDLEQSLFNIVKRNNLPHVIVWESLINIFFRNYWYNWAIPLPKPILCVLIYIPWLIIIYYVIFDFCPRIIPYTII